jgi:uncharacterized protein (DUF302 family)
MASYGMTISLTGKLEEVKAQLAGELKTQGFGILTEIDMQKVMKEKIGADYEPYLILGICNQQFANRALSADRSMGLLLPCTAVRRQAGAEVEVSILDPEAAFSVVESQTQKALEGFPQEVKKRLQAALSGMKNISAG